MADLSTGGSGGGAAYTYVQDAQPSGAQEGESWYDTGANAAYVYDGASWIEQTVVDHGSLSGVGTSDHHSKTTVIAKLPGDVTSSRTPGNTYTNNTGNPLHVTVRASNYEGQVSLEFKLEGTIVDQLAISEAGGSGNSATGTVDYVVPDGASYTVSVYYGDLKSWIQQQIEVA